jgi:hypothetical protein
MVNLKESELIFGSVPPESLGDASATFAICAPGLALDQVEETVATASSAPEFVGARCVNETHRRVRVDRYMIPRTGSPGEVSELEKPNWITFFEVTVESNPAPLIVILKVSELINPSDEVISGSTESIKQIAASAGSS